MQFNYWFPVETGDPGSGYDFGEIPGGGYGGGPTPDPTPPSPPPVYNTPGASQAANDFAKQNMDDQNSSDPEFKQFNKATHDTLAKLYDFAKANPDNLMKIGEHNVKASDVLAASEKGHISLTTNNDPSYIGNNGARTLHGSSTNSGYISSTTYINPDHSNMHTAINYGPSAVNSVIAHEMGHQIIKALGLSVGAGHAETDANIAGRSILNAIGMPAFASPPGGYTYP